MNTRDGDLRKAESSEEAIADKVSTFERPKFSELLENSGERSSATTYILYA